MRVKINELQEGCILAAGIYGKTNHPIMPEKTVLTGKHLEILRAFLINEVEVENMLDNGKTFLPQEVIEEEKSLEPASSVEMNFMELYLRSVQEYKKEFTSWQSGKPVDITRVRSIFIPLLEQIESNPTEVFSLYQQSTKDNYLYEHSMAVGLISGYLAKKLSYLKGDLVQIALAGCLADCGMAKVSAKILNKKTSLTVEEHEEVKKHPTYSFKLVQHSPLLRDATKLAIVQHHERLDGSGYPSGEKAKRIHPFAKIIAVADIFHAMTSERWYKPKLSPFKVLEMLYEDQFGTLDFTVLKALRTGFLNCSSGSKIKLSNGQMAEVVFVEEKSPTRPLIKLLETGSIISLQQNRQLFIEEVIQ